jgi:predicted enzyme related to lactoylglutathione lyase
MAPQAKTKEELLESIRISREKLNNKFSKLTPEQMVWPGSMDDWSVKDILMHLVDWEQRFIHWYHQGLRGEKPQTPAPGMTWRDLPKLNQMGYEKHKDEPLEFVLAQYEKSHQEIYKLVESMQEKEIFEKNHYAWTGKYPLLIWIDANTASHYVWAQRNIRTKVLSTANLQEKPINKKKSVTSMNWPSFGAVVYVKDLLLTSLFYQNILNLLLVQQEQDFIVLKKENFDLILVKTPAEIAATIHISSPPGLREDTPIKLVFPVAKLSKARELASQYGGHIHTKEQEWDFQYYRVCDGLDPEGNIFQLREAIS